MSGGRPCVCGHPREAHRHYRRGSDCALCGPEACPRYRPARWWRRATTLGPDPDERR